MKAKSSVLALAVILVLGFQSTAHAADYTAHEWGTFTSVQGSDGNVIAWNPFTVAELPSFVHERNRTLATGTTNLGTLLLSKQSSGKWLQRMETPVIYFYTDIPMRADVTVDFPEGQVTEWFPRVESFGPRGEVKRSYARWTGVEIKPSSAAAERALPMDKSGSHYYAARETDAALVTVAPPFPTGQAETDKFLFYRGVGNFKAPLHARFEGDKLVLLNRGGEELPHLFVLEVRGQLARTLAVPALGGGGDVAVELPASKGFRPLIEVRAEISAAMEHALTQSGLYAREAAAMVKTWADSWFSEAGTRVLYTLPRAWTDRVLPLQLDPAPRDLVRVFVGRAEIFTPEVEQSVAIMNKLVPQPDQRAQLMARIKQSGLGRFAEAAVTNYEARKSHFESTVAHISTSLILGGRCSSPIPSALNSRLPIPQTTLNIPATTLLQVSVAGIAGSFLTNSLQFQLPPSAELQPPPVSLR